MMPINLIKYSQINIKAFDMGRDIELGGLFAFVNESLAVEDTIEKEIEEVVRNSPIVFESEGNLSGKVTRFDANMKAIKLLKSKDTFSENDIATISLYSGWGGLEEAFESNTKSEKWKERVEALTKLLEEHEYISARRGVLDAFFTPDNVIKEMWTIAEKLGFNGGNILEPSCGVGRFLALTPATLRQNVSFSCVEKDTISAKVAQTIYPMAEIVSRGIEETIIESDKALVIGNPPYGDFKVTDANNKNYASFNIHNYFVLKSLDALQRGGILIFVITSNFLDNISQKLMTLIEDKADFIDAIRLPSDTFSSTGTSVTTDIVVFRKKVMALYNEDEALLSWMMKGKIGDMSVNQYFLDNPSQVLGDMQEGYRGIKVIGDKDKREAQFKRALERFPRNIVSASAELSGSGFSEALVPNQIWIENDNLLVNIKTKEGNKTIMISDKPAIVKKASLILDIKEKLLALMDAQIDESLDSETIEGIRAHLLNAYDAFYKKYGYLNKSSNFSIYKLDIRAELIAALEKNYDKGISEAVSKSTGKPQRAESGEKADILVKRTAKAKGVLQAQNPKEALLLSLNHKGSVNLDFMAEISGAEKGALITALKGEIFFDEKLSEWVFKDIFLSGDIKQKIAYTSDEETIKALGEVKPKDLTAKDIVPSIGASWISQEIIQQYAEEELGFYNVTVSFAAFVSKWGVKGYGSSKFMTKRRGADAILQAALNSTYIKIMETGYDGKKYVNVEETELANAKKEELSEHFLRWVYQDSARRKALVEKYNETFNRYLPLAESSLMDMYEPQNLSDTFKPRKHQKRATFKAIFDENPYIFNHKVGSGKTLNAQMVAMEMKRLGKANKPMIVTLKSVLPDFVRDFKLAYPNAVILAPAENDFTKSKRAQMLSKIALGNFDCIVLTHEQMKSIANPKQLELDILNDELQMAIDTVASTKRGGSRVSVKEIENIRIKLEAKIEGIKSEKEQFLNFEELGIDALLVDESHFFKKLTYTSSLNRVAGMPDRAGSQRAYDLFLKVRHIMKKNGGKNVVFLTGTVVTNSLVELYLVQKYLQFDELKKQGLNTFDSWAKNYAEIVTDIEISPSSKFVEKSRMSQFKNISTLMQMVGNILDTVTNEDIKKSSKDFKLPPLKEGKPSLVFVEPSKAQLDYVGQPDENNNYKEGTLVYRSENMPTDGSDNHLLLFTDAGKCAIDMRLIDDSHLDVGESKISKVAGNAKAKYDEFNAVKGTQIIFCDSGVPKNSKSVLELEVLIDKADNGDKEAQKTLEQQYTDAEIDSILSGSEFSVYEDIKKKLITQGVPSEEIVFVHDYNSKIKKAELSEKMNSGEIRVTIGSTIKAGTGLNVQKRIVAVHHVDIPHMPSDLEQRNGRIDRQGNMLIDLVDNFEIEIFYYATRKTLDGVKWQTIERKAKFIEDFMNGSVEVEGGGELEHSTSELSEMMKAEASGNQLLMQKIRLDRKIKKIERLKTSFVLEVQEREDKIDYITEWLPKAKIRESLLKEELLNLLENGIEIMREELSDATNESKLGASIMKQFRESDLNQRVEFNIGFIGEKEIKGLLMGGSFIIEIEGEGEVRREFARNTKGYMFVKWLKALQHNLEGMIENIISSQSYETSNLENLKALSDSVFSQENKLISLKEEQLKIIKDMAEEAKPKTPKAKEGEDKEVA